MNDDLVYQAKLMYLKHFTSQDLNSVKVDAVDVPQEIIDDFISQFKAEYQNHLEVYQKKKDVLDQLQKEVGDKGIEVEAFKYYGKCDSLQIAQKKSGFVNRFIGKGVFE